MAGTLLFFFVIMPVAMLISRLTNEYNDV